MLSPTGLPDHRSPALSPSTTSNNREIPPRSLDPRQASSPVNDRSRLQSQKHSEPQILSNQPSHYDLTSKYAQNHHATFLSAKSREIIQSVRDSFQDQQEEQPEQIFQNRSRISDDVDRYLQRGQVVMNQDRRENKILGHLSGTRGTGENNEYRPLRQRSVEKQDP